MKVKNTGTKKYMILSKFGILMIAAFLFTPLIPLQTVLGADAESHWWDNAWESRIEVWVNETNGIDQGDFVMDLWIDFSKYDVRNATNEVRVTYWSEDTGEEIERPVQIVKERNSGERSYEARVVFQTVNMEAYASHAYYIYFNNPDATTPSSLYTDFNPDLIKNRLLEPSYENNNYDLLGPTDIDVDDQGNIYIVDRGNHRVQIFDSNLTHLNTIGTSRESGSDDNRFSYPSGIAVANNRICVVDSGNHRVQIFDLEGSYITTLGTPGQAGYNDTEFDSPKNIAVDGDGKVYVTDCGNQRIQIFDNLDDNIADDTIGTTGTAGTGNNEFNNPYGIAILNNRIYVSDSANHRVQILDMNGNWVDTIGQTGRIGSTNDLLFYPYGVDADSSGNVYVADHKNHRIQIFDNTGAYSNTIGVTSEFGRGNAYLNNPHNVAISSDRILVADYENNRVQIYDLDGNHLRTIGSGLIQAEHTDFNDPRDVTVGSDGKVYVADRKNHRVQIFDSNYTYLQTIGTSGESGDLHTHLSSPYDVDIGTDMIAIADAGNDRIQLFDLNGTYLKTLEGAGGNEFDYPCGVKIDDENNLIFVADTYAERVHVYEKDLTYITTIYGADPKYTDTGDPSGNITFAHPYDIELGPNGMIYVLDTDHQAIQIFYGNNYSYSNTIEGGDFDGGNWYGDLKWTCGFDIFEDKIYLADTYNHRIKIITINGDYVGCIGYNGTSGSGDGHFSRPRGLGVGPDGKIYVADADNSRVQVFYPNLTLSRSISTTGLGIFDNKHLNVPEGIGLDASGNIYIADSNNYRIQAYDAVGSYLFTIGSSTKREAGSDNDHLFIPAGVAIGNDRIYVADKGNARIQTFDMNGIYDDTLSIDCYEVAIGPQGYVYSAFAPNHCINVHTSTGDYVQTLGTPGSSGNDTEHLNFPTGVRVADDGKVYVADGQNHRVLIYNDLTDHIADGIIGVTEESGSDIHHLSSPSTVGCWDGKLYIADVGNQRIQVFDTDGNYLSTIGVTGKPGSDNLHFNSPTGVFVGQDGKIYVADRDNNRIVKITDVSADMREVEHYDASIYDQIPWMYAIFPIIAVIIIVIILALKRRTPSASKGVKMRLPVNIGYSYLINEKKPIRTFEISSQLAKMESYSILMIVRTSPSNLEEDYGIRAKKILWLSRVESEKENVESIKPSPLTKPLSKILSFIEENENPVIVLEGIEHLISENGYSDVMRFLDSIIPVVATSKGIFMVPVDEETLSSQDYSLMARQMKMLE
ncbi:MAG: DUF835 domain-containing protein [Thermoplasmata archaeon]|nr:DUF835 domain-containing protein [Thermoplasmata archaeon]